ncbi:MAG: carbohydrate ABC transporter permease, partial [Coleofasciculus sp. C2-GNP5-27]
MKSKRRRKSNSVKHLSHQLQNAFNSLPVHLSIIVISLIWTLPTVGLLISSLRPKDDLLDSGWWMVFQHPFDFTQYQLGNYIDVLTAE